ncbi:MAG: cytochrome c maturation protein CcmE [Proteobacteria bacterium]|nr:cytochrome c maturation protein CcmE [Pseudomonadota bacterium]
MKRKHKRLTFVVVALGLLGLAAGLILSAFEESIVFFYSPTDIAEKNVAEGRRIRLGGLVEEGSVKKAGGAVVNFRVTDLTTTIPVTYKGLLPDLFSEGQGVITEGTLGPDGVFVAREVLAKHDETYMPREVADALKKAGQWQGGETSQ